MEAAGSSETFGTINEATWRHISEESNFAESSLLGYKSPEIQ
jgi:hypothetical protein